MQLEKKTSFGKWESVCLLLNLICPKLLIFFKRMLVEDAGNAGWILTIYISLIAFAFFVIISRLYNKFEGVDIIDVAEIAGGKVLKIATGIIISVVLLFLTVNVLREFSEENKVISLTLSPLSYIMVFFMAGMVIGSYFGIEAIVRYSAIIVPVIAFCYILILLGTIPAIDINNIFPILGNGADDIFLKGFLRVSVFGELLILFLLPPFIGGNKKMKIIGYSTLALSSFFLISGSLMYVLAFPYPVVLEPFLPVYEMARIINLGRFFQRIEAIFVLIWDMSALLYLTSSFYFTVYSFSRAAGVKYMRPLLLPFAIIVFSMAFMPQNLITVIQIETGIINKFLWLVSFIFPALILIVANIRKRIRRTANDDREKS